jgi:hypothetical protein
MRNVFQNDFKKFSRAKTPRGERKENLPVLRLDALFVFFDLASQAPGCNTKLGRVT